MGQRCSDRCSRDRQREILRRVVEEYVATGQPVGSKTLVERGGARRLAVDRAGRARRARAARAAHASAHLGRPRADRGRLPHLRRRAARAAGAAARRRSRSSSPAARAEVEEALQATTEMLSQVTRLLALVSAPPLEAATVRHVEVLLLQPNVVMVVVITSTGGVTKQRFAFPEPVDAGLVDVGRRLPATSASPALRLGSRAARARFDEPSLGPRERAFLHAIRGAFEQAAEDEPAALRRRRRRAARRDARRGDRRLPQPDGRAREARRAARRARAARSTRAGRSPASATSSSSRACASSRSSARRTASRTSTLGAVSLLGPLRMDYEKALALGPLGRARALALRRRRLRRDELHADGDAPTATTTSCSASPATPTSRRSRRRSGGSRASSIPTSPSEPDAEARFREVTEAYEVLSNSETRAALRPLRARRASARAGSRRRTSTSAASATSSPRSSATTSSAAARGGGAARAAPTSAPRSRSSSSRRRAATTVDGAVRGRGRRARRCGGDGVEPGTTPVDLRPLRRHRAGCSRSRAASSASSCARTRARTASGRGADRRAPVHGVRRRRPRRSSERELDVDVPAGIHDGQRIRVSGEGHAGALGGRAGDVYVARARQARRALRARGQRHLLAGRPDDRPGRARRDGDGRDARRARSSSSSPPGIAAGRGARPARARACPCCRASAAATSACSSTSRSRAGSPTSSGGCSRSSTRASDEHTYRHDEGFFEKLKSAFR